MSKEFFGGPPSPPPAEAEHQERREGREIVIEKKTLVLMVGLPGSGKSTFAIDHFPTEAIVSSDRIRGEISNNSANQVVSDKAFQLAIRIVSERLKRGEIVVMDAQNLVEGTRTQFYQMAEKHGAKVEAIFLDVSPEEAAARDKGRVKGVGEKYIKNRKGAFETAKRSLETSAHIDRVHVIGADEMRDVDIRLPEDDMESLAADKELRREAGVAESLIMTAETGYLRKEIPHGPETMELSAGSVMFAAGTEDPKIRAFLKANFLPHQVVDAESVAKRLAADVNDDAVRDVMSFLLKNRAHLNLTTVAAYPTGFVHRPALESTLTGVQEKIGVPVPRAEFTADDAERYQHVRVTREAPDDTPLFLIGDVQGCYEAMREHAGRIRRENLADEDAGEEGPPRTIVFVGDMADRGPLDPESVIYITALVRAGRAILVKGNHDENLLTALKGGEGKPAPVETRETARELKERLSQKSIDKIVEMLEQAPLYAQWKNLVVAHAALPRIPRPGQVLDAAEHKIITHGPKSGMFTGTRADVHSLRHSAAHDPEILLVGGHTHEEEPIMDMISGTTVLDAGVELKGKLWGMYYPELELASADEPTVLKLHEQLESGELPQGQELAVFIEWARQQGLIEVKAGHAEYEGLAVTSYSGATEVQNLWERYPTLRHFRGLIVGPDGVVVARPFKKTHKAGIEIPLEQLDMKPEHVFEKANGSMGIVYNWNGKWNAATKFSFENDNYTKPTEEMLGAADVKALDPSKTYLFEIILPNDAHIVDYGGKRELVLLNAIAKETGEEAPWDEVKDTAGKLGVRTAEDFSERFKGMTIAELYRHAQEPGNLPNLEGLMAIYRDANGEKITVKVKAREYDDKKFVRDRLDWERVIEAIDRASMDIPPEAVEKLLGYNFDNTFAKDVLATRIAWMKEHYRQAAAEMRELMFSPITDAEKILEAELAKGTEKRQAVDIAVQKTAPQVLAWFDSKEGKAMKGDRGGFMAFLRAVISGEEKPEAFIAKLAIKRIEAKVAETEKKKGKNAFWILPE